MRGNLRSFGVFILAKCCGSIKKFDTHFLRILNLASFFVNGLFYKFVFLTFISFFHFFPRSKPLKILQIQHGGLNISAKIIFRARSPKNRPVMQIAQTSSFQGLFLALTQSIREKPRGCGWLRTPLKPSTTQLMAMQYNPSMFCEVIDVYF